MCALNYDSWLILLQFIYCVENTIDMKNTDFEYIANHLTLEECRKFVASLYFVSHELPDILDSAERKVPEASCIDLLLHWNSGTESWEGQDKTHEDLGHRLRQMGKDELAVWLGKTVFHELARDVNETLLNNPFAENDLTKVTVVESVRTDNYDEDWTAFDSVLWVALAGLYVCIVIVCYRIICLTYNKKAKQNLEEELHDLLLQQSLDDDEDSINKTI